MCRCIGRHPCPTLHHKRIPCRLWHRCTAWCRRCWWMSRWKRCLDHGGNWRRHRWLGDLCQLLRRRKEEVNIGALLENIQKTHMYLPAGVVKFIHVDGDDAAQQAGEEESESGGTHCGCWWLFVELVAWCCLYIISRRSYDCAEDADYFRLNHEGGKCPVFYIRIFQQIHFMTAVKIFSQDSEGDSSHQLRTMERFVWSKAKLWPGRRLVSIGHLTLAVSCTINPVTLTTVQLVTLPRPAGGWWASRRTIRQPLLVSCAWRQTRPERYSDRIEHPIRY